MNDVPVCRVEELPVGAHRVVRVGRREVGVFKDFYVHESYMRGNVLYASAINDGFLALLDVTDPARIAQITRFATGGGVTHNSWLTRDGRLLMLDPGSIAIVGSEHGRPALLTWNCRCAQSTSGGSRQ